MSSVRPIVAVVRLGWLDKTLPPHTQMMATMTTMNDGLIRRGAFIPD
jgi:hypothetical protein